MTPATTRTLWRRPVRRAAATVITGFAVCLVAASTALATASPTPPSWSSFTAQTSAQLSDSLNLQSLAEDFDADNDATTVAPASVDVAPLVAWARQNAADSFAGLDVDSGAVYVGFTSEAGDHLEQMHEAFPAYDLRLYGARHTESELRAIDDNVNAMMGADQDVAILSVGTDTVRNVVSVGVADTNSAVAQSIKRDYGDAVDVFTDVPLESLVRGPEPGPVGTPAPGRDDFKDPMLAGMRISSAADGTSCTAGFGYRGTLLQTPSQAGGVITAGHCFDGEAPTTEWRQGGKVLGAFSRRRDVNRSRADAGTITTEFAPNAGFRSPSNEVFIFPGAATIKITKLRALNAGQRGDEICISGAFSGFQCGVLRQVGPGGRGINYQLRRGVIIRGVYRTDFQKACLLGDSGAPMFTGDGVADGIAFARNPRNPRQCFYSQIRNVQNELRVPVLRH